MFPEYADEIYNASLYTDKSYSTAVKKVDIYPDIKHMTFDDDEVKYNYVPDPVCCFSHAYCFCDVCFFVAV